MARACACEDFVSDSYDATNCEAAVVASAAATKSIAKTSSLAFFMPANAIRAKVEIEKLLWDILSNVDDTRVHLSFQKVRNHALNTYDQFTLDIPARIYQVLL